MITVVKNACDVCGSQEVETRSWIFPPVNTGGDAVETALCWRHSERTAWAYNKGYHDGQIGLSRQIDQAR
ncbi:MAG: hypothetical protein NVSMB52_03500 [Chloroflexota bacterium]